MQAILSSSKKKTRLAVFYSCTGDQSAQESRLKLDEHEQRRVIRRDGQQFNTVWTKNIFDSLWHQTFSLFLSMDPRTRRQPPPISDPVNYGNYRPKFKVHFRNQWSGTKRQTSGDNGAANSNQDRLAADNGGYRSFYGQGNGCPLSKTPKS